jgi:predicted TIM-barrel fold metal-dependent hydrolase
MIYEGLELATVFRRSIEVLGVSRLLFGSDSSYFPRGFHSAILEQQSKALYELGLDAQQASQILCSNLEQLHKPRVLRVRDNGTERTE